jgi:hypothetical protein
MKPSDLLPITKTVLWIIVKNWNKKKREKKCQRNNKRRKPKGITKGGRERERVREYLVGESKKAWNTWGEKNGWNWCFKRTRKAGIISCPACR